MVFLDAPRQAVYLYFPYQLFPLKRAVPRLNMHAVFSFFQIGICWIRQMIRTKHVFVFLQKLASIARE